MVVPLDLSHAGAVNHEDRHPLAVQAPDTDVAQLAATHEPEGPKEQILGLEHPCLPQPHAHGLPEESWIRVGAGRGEIRLSFDLGPAPGESAKIDPVPARLLQLATLPRKPLRAKTLSSGIFVNHNIG